MSVAASIRAIALSLLLTLGFFGAILAVSERDNIRLHGPDRNRYNAIFNQEGRVHLATSGTSRGRRAMYAPYLAADLKEQVGIKKPVVYELSINSDGIDAQTSILRMLLENRKVDAIVMQLYYKGEFANITHPRYHQLGSLYDILFAPYDQNLEGNRLTNRALLIYRRISDTLDYCIDDIRACFATPSPEPKPARSFDDSPPKPVEPSKAQANLNRAKEAGTVFYHGPRNWKLDGVLNDRNRYFFDKLIALAEKKGTTVIAIDIPGSGRGQVDEQLATQIEAELGIDYLYPKQSELEQHYFDFYGDVGHVNLRGERYYRKRVIDHLNENAADIFGN